MKMPKSKTQIYIVMRSTLDGNQAAVGSFLTYEGADNYKGSCEQSWKDHGFTEDEGHFYLDTVIYYNE